MFTLFKLKALPYLTTFWTLHIYSARGIFSHPWWCCWSVKAWITNSTFLNSSLRPHRTVFFFNYAAKGQHVQIIETESSFMADLHLYLQKKDSVMTALTYLSVFTHLTHKSDIRRLPAFKLNLVILSADSEFQLIKSCFFCAELTGQSLKYRKQPHTIHLNQGHDQNPFISTYM